MISDPVKEVDKPNCRYILKMIGVGWKRYAGIAQLVEHHLAKVAVASSSLVSRFYSGRHSQVVRQRSAKPLFPGSNPGGAFSNN